MYINELQRFSVSVPASPTVILHGLAPACPFRLRRRRISLHDSTNIAIFGEKTNAKTFGDAGGFLSSN
ncbi:MAG: hypothetical protein ACLVK4_10670 [Alistipes shahii]|uniref:hypothetical protein n=1 Tax=Alistipes shahii TaxID=328814 RepID=UPI00399D3A7E